jgi:hypothetical protein
MKGVDSAGAHLVHVPGWMDGCVDLWMGGWMGGWVDGWVSRLLFAVYKIIIKFVKIVEIIKNLNC